MSSVRFLFDSTKGVDLDINNDGLLEHFEMFKISFLL